MPNNPDNSPRDRSILRSWLAKGVRFVVVTVLFGYFYGWASTWCFPRDVRAGFPLGMLHGAIMPMSLPSLVMGRDVEIYAANNSGRLYKLGYTVGINVCGLVFFGSLFWRPAGRKTLGGQEPE